MYISLKPRQRSVCAWVARMIYCAIWGLVHDLAVPPPPWTLPMVPSLIRNCNAERNPVSSALKHTLCFCFWNQGLQSSICTILPRCVYIIADTGNVSRCGCPSASHSFYCTWSTVGSRPGAFSRRSDTTLIWLKHQLTMSWNFLWLLSVKFHISFYRVNPKPSPELLRIWINLHWLC